MNERFIETAALHLMNVNGSTFNAAWFEVTTLAYDELFALEDKLGMSAYD